ncbi:hypothetical protein [uncultured Desulfosarcina sp.]|uniref:hypothetical protein n=1 Tax=uncultured Desulfosarcina sp. TaxID=218289 RepID=UPI0029C8BA85|nr:hypothetical protein [uncultured Desulfosarcina sp.]
MDYHRSSVPWNTRALWQEANASLATTVRQNRSVIAESRRQAHQIKCLLELTFPHMDRLCRTSCPDCTDICCQRAWIWADFKDLLFCHLAGIPVPDRQLLGRQEDHCRYGGPAGCRLERIRRPFVCTWYLCPAQTQRLRKEPAELQTIQETLRQIKGLRQKMERSFIRAVT